MTLCTNESATKFMSIAFKRILFVTDPLPSLNIKKDTSLTLMKAAQDLGAKVAATTTNALTQKGPVSSADCQWLWLSDEHEPQATFSEKLALNCFDIIMMRKDPPWNQEYLYATFALEAAQAQGCMVINNPHALRTWNEKLAILNFPQTITQTVVTANAQEITSFLQTEKDIVLKPLDGMGGEGIFRLTEKDPNKQAIIKLSTQGGNRPIMCQKYLPEIQQGDKRILLFMGKPACNYALARFPAPGETRANLAQGGKGEVVPLTARDHWLCEQVGESLRRAGLWFVGLDVIGDYITEINFTSPTCLREIQSTTQTPLAKQWWTKVSHSLPTKEHSL